jgi:hypothetical protein
MAARQDRAAPDAGGGPSVGKQAWQTISAPGVYQTSSDRKARRQVPQDFAGSRNMAPPTLSAQR